MRILRITPTDASLADVEEKDGQEEAGGMSAAQLSRLMWSPWLARACMKRRTNEIERDAHGLDEAVVSAMDRAKKFHTYY